MSFQFREVWHSSFHESDAKTSLPKKLNFTDSTKIIELAKRGTAFLNLEHRQGVEHGISMGRGGVWLNLTLEQCRKLKA